MPGRDAQPAAVGVTILQRAQEERGRDAGVRGQRDGELQRRDHGRVPAAGRVLTLPPLRGNVVLQGKAGNGGIFRSGKATEHWLLSVTACTG